MEPGIEPDNLLLSRQLEIKYLQKCYSFCRLHKYPTESGINPVNRLLPK
jgi:hypothetical protein